MWVKFTHRKNGFPAWGLLFDVFLSAARDIVVDRFHALLGQRPGIADGLLADPTKPRVHRRVVGVGGLGIHHAARTEPLTKVRKIPRVRIIRQFRLLLGVEVIQIAVELVEAVRRRQEFVAVAEVVLAELCITGQHGLRTGMTKVGLPAAPVGLSKLDPTIAELLKPLGYATAIAVFPIAIPALVTAPGIAAIATIAMERAATDWSPGRLAPTQPLASA
jgi:hypothetical protein